MPSLEFAVLCDQVLLDQNKPSLIGIFSTITTKVLPATHAKMALALSVRVDDEDIHEVSVQPFGPDNKPMVDARKKMVQASNGTVGYILNIQNFVVKKAGNHYFEFKIDGKRIAQVRFTVELVLG